MTAKPVLPLVRSLTLASLTLASLTLACPAQNWVGFGDNAWPAGNTLSTRGTIAPFGAGELMVRLDASEHGGWGTDPAFPGTRTIDAVKFYAHATLPFQAINLWFYNEGLPHQPGAPLLLALNVPIAFSPVPVLHVATFPPVRQTCTVNGDMFIAFAVTPFDAVMIGQIDTTTDVPAPVYGPRPFWYPPFAQTSHCYSMPTIPPFPLPGYLPGPSQFYVDVAHAPSLASGVGGAMTNQPTFLNSLPSPGTSDFLSGSFPDCTGTLGGRALVSDIATMKIRPPTVCPPAPGSIVLFTLSAGPIMPCTFEVSLGLIIPGVCTTGVICIDPSTIFAETIAPLAMIGDTVVQYPLLPTYVGLGATHQAFILDPTTVSVHAGPCDRQDL